MAGNGVKVKPWRKNVMQNSGLDPDQEAKVQSQAQLEQRHLEAYRNMHRLRDALYHRYAALLKEKVHSQRLLQHQRNNTARAKSENETKPKKKKLAFSKLQHNDSYLKSLPKTSYYLKQLAERGHLKTHHDLEDFYRSIEYNHQPSQLKRSLQDIRKKMLNSRPAADLTSQLKTSDKHPCTAEERGHEDNNRHSRLLEQGSHSAEILAELIFSREKDDSERLFPKINIPTFATLQPNIMRNVQSKIPELIIPEIPERSRKAEIYLSRLRQMYNLCLTNMAFSKRLLDRETDLLCWQEEPGIQDLVQLPGIDSKQGKGSQTNQLPLSSPKQPSSVQTDQPSCPQHLSRTASSSQRCFETPVWDPAMCRRKTPKPLSTEDLCQQKHIIDHGCKLWRNYT
uniref:uncharacterized protein LOC109962309 isoform X2 n=1 Tax=Monopterus albus TaxID=43700 RepID=UPI0009B3A53A|nr:uncharacterized protein LOC109962309 isoform X2 [Monopterus albus]